MFAWAAATRIYLAVGATDLRKGFDGLYALVAQRLALDPLSGHVFVFANRARTRLKLLFWDGSGLWVAAKRLGRGRFRWPAAAEGDKLQVTAEELAAVLGGLDLTAARRRAWFRRVI
ncbi:MAG: IS66 family insertion sequence element accessory protein TnpB [Bryobacteraceae bacterium]